MHTRLHRKLPQSKTFTERQRGCRGVKEGGAGGRRKEEEGASQTNTTDLEMLVASVNA